MRLLISEFICGGGLCAEPLPAALLQEGTMMWRTLVQECLQIDDIQLVTTMDARLDCGIENIQVKQLTSTDDYAEVLTSMSANVDLVWLIAPESNGVLSELSLRIQKMGVPLIGSDAESVAIASDKRVCNAHLAGHGIAVIPILNAEEIAGFALPVVVKRVDGVSCEGMKLLENGYQANQLALDPKHWIVQPYIVGEHFSLSLLCMSGDARVLSCNRQNLTIDDEFVFNGCVVNEKSITAEHERLAQSIANAIPGLSAYIGVDLIVNEEGMQVVDVNPRLSTSYVGLGKARGINVASLCIQAIMDKQLPEFKFMSNVSVEVDLVN